MFGFEYWHSGESTQNTCVNTMLLKLVISLFKYFSMLDCRLCCHSQLQDCGSNCRCSSARRGESPQPGSEECECIQIHHSSDC